MNTEKVISRDGDYILHTYGRSQVVLAEGKGMTARDADGKEYLDFTSGIGVNSLGYCHPAWVILDSLPAGQRLCAEGRGQQKRRKPVDCGVV